MKNLLKFVNLIYTLVGSTDIAVISKMNVGGHFQILLL